MDGRCAHSLIKLVFKNGYSVTSASPRDKMREILTLEQHVDALKIESGQSCRGVAKD